MTQPAPETGGQPQPTTGTGAGTGAPQPPQGAPGPTPPPEGQTDPATGPAGGVEALRAELVGERRARQESEQRFTQFQEQMRTAFATLTGQPSEQPVTMEGLMTEIAALRQRDQEREAEALTRVITTEVRAAATRLNFHNPDDALGAVEEVAQLPDGSPDLSDIERQVKALAESRPYLIRTDPPAAGSSAAAAGIGSRGTGTEPAPGKDRLASAYQSSGTTTKIGKRT